MHCCNIVSLLFVFDVSQNALDEFYVLTQGNDLLGKVNDVVVGRLDAEEDGLEDVRRFSIHCSRLLAKAGLSCTFSAAR